MSFKIDGSEFTIEELLHHISKGRSEHFKQTIIDILIAAERERDEAIAQRDRLGERFHKATQYGLKLKEELARRDAAEGEPLAFTHESEISNMHATGLYIRGFPADRRLNAEEGYTVALYTAAPPAVLPPPLDNWHNSASGVMQSLQFKGDELSFTVGANWMRCQVVELGAQPQKPVVMPAPEKDGGTDWPGDISAGRANRMRDKCIAAIEAANVKYEVKE